jgi:hypothetical protein
MEAEEDRSDAALKARTKPAGRYGAKKPVP